jgi:hypothetical protein
VCTVSLLRAPWIGEASGRSVGELPLFRLVASRDEQRSRPHALPPRRTRRERLEVLAPVDPSGGGTWVAASSAGLVFVLLNEYGRVSPADQVGRRSRGLVIPALASSESLDAAVVRASSLDPKTFLPFRLLIIDRHRLVELVADGRTLTATGQDCSSLAVLRCSSSVDQDPARACRTALFSHVLARPSRLAQDAFHRATWPGDGALGVRMWRKDACTVSITAVDVYERQISMTYDAGVAAAGAPVVEQLRVSNLAAQATDWLPAG